MIFDTPLRVGYVVKRYPKYSETFIVNEILAHEDAGLDVEVFALRPTVDTHFQDRISRVRAPVHHLPPAAAKTAAFWDSVREASEKIPGFWPQFQEACARDVAEVVQAVRVAVEVHRRGISHLHAHFATSAAAVARMAARFTGISYSITAHAKDIFHESVDMCDLREKFAEASDVITVSDFNVEYLRAQCGAAAGRVRRIYNGMDLSELEFASPSRRPPQILAVGRLVEKKGFGVLVEACQLLRDRGREFSCQIVGTGDLEADLKKQIAVANLQGVISLPGPLPQREVFERLREASVFVAPCVVGGDGNRDGLPTVLLEAMALGTPCVSTGVTGIPEVLKHNDTGLLVAQGDAVALAAGIERLLDDAQLRISLAQRARRLIEAEFDIHRNAASIRDLFAAAVSARSRRHEPHAAFSPDLHPHALSGAGALRNS